MRHRAHSHSAVGTPLRTQTPAMGSGANSIVDSIRQQPDPHRGSGLLPLQRPPAETSRMPPLRQIRKAMSGRPDARLLTGSWSRP